MLTHKLSVMLVPGYVDLGALCGSNLFPLRICAEKHMTSCYFLLRLAFSLGCSPCLLAMAAITNGDHGYAPQIFRLEGNVH